MKISARSLGLFFLLAGGCGFIHVLTFAVPFFFGAHLQGVPFHAIFALIVGLMATMQLLFALGNLYIGFKMAELLVDRPELPLRFTRVTLWFSALTFNIFGALVNYYILLQLKRLAQEAEPAVETHTLS